MQQVESPSTEELVLDVLGCKPEKRSEEQILLLSDHLQKIFSFLNIKREDCNQCAKSCIKLTYHQNQSILKLRQQVEYFYYILDGQVSLNYLLQNSESDQQDLQQDSNQQQNLTEVKLLNDNQNELLQSLSSQQQVQKRTSQRISEIIERPKKNSIISRYQHSQLLPYKQLKKFDYFGNISICLKQICQYVAQCTSKHAVLLAIPKDVFNSTLKFYFSYIISNDIEYLEKYVHFFKNWNNNLLKRIILFGQKQQLKRGNLLYNEGDIADSIFLIVEGEFSAFKQYTYAPSFLVKAELNDVEKMRAQTRKEMENKKQQKSLKILMVGKGEMIGESELFLDQDQNLKRSFSVITESQDAIVIKLHHQIFKELVLTDTKTKQSILNLHHQRMQFVEEKVQSQKQKLSQFLDFFFQSSEDQQMKKKSSEFLKNSLKNIDQLNKDQYNKFLQKTYNAESPQKKQFCNNTQNQKVFKSEEKQGLISIPTLNYIIQDKQSNIVTEQDQFNISNLNTNLTKQMKHSCKDNRIYETKTIQDAENQKNSDQINADGGLKYFNSFFYRYLEQKQNNFEEPLISVQKSRRQLSMENLSKQKQKSSNSPSKLALSRQNSLILHKMNQIQNQQEKQNSLQTECWLKTENQIISLSNLQLRQPSPSLNDNKNKLNFNNSCLKVEEQSQNYYNSKSTRKNTLDSIIGLNQDSRQSSLTKLSPQLKNRKIISQSSHLRLKRQDQISLSQDHKNSILTERRTPQKSIQYKSNSINEIHDKNEEYNGLVIPKKLQISSKILYSRAHQTVNNIKSSSSLNQINQREKQNFQQNENQIIFLNNCPLKTVNTIIEEKNAQEMIQPAFIKQLTLPQDTQSKQLNSEETPFIYTSTQSSAKNHTTVFRNSVYKNFNEIFNTTHNDSQMTASNKNDQQRKSSFDFNSSQQQKKIIQNSCNSGVIYKQGVQLSYYQTNQHQTNIKSIGLQNNISQNKQPIQSIYQLNNFIKSPQSQSNLTQNIHVNNSKFKNSFDVFDKILNQKLNKSPKIENSKLIQSELMQKLATIKQNYY